MPDSLLDKMCSVSREQLLGRAQITMRKHLWFMAVWDGSVFATPWLKWFQNVFGVDCEVEQTSSNVPPNIFCIFYKKQTKAALPELPLFGLLFNLIHFHIGLNCQITNEPGLFEQQLHTVLHSVIPQGQKVKECSQNKTDSRLCVFR